MNLTGQISNEYSQRIDEEAQTYKELFSDDDDRVKAFAAWNDKRNIWIERQKLLEQTRNFFAELYKICTDLERESAALELVVADGFIRDRAIPE